MQRAFKLHLNFSELKSRTDALERALSEFPTAVVLFSVEGKVVFVNAIASSLLSQKDGLLIV